MRDLTTTMQAAADAIAVAIRMQSDTLESDTLDHKEREISERLNQSWRFAQSALRLQISRLVPDEDAAAWLDLSRKIMGRDADRCRSARGY